MQTYVVLVEFWLPAPRPVPRRGADGYTVSGAAMVVVAPWGWGLETSLHMEGMAGPHTVVLTGGPDG